MRQIKKFQTGGQMTAPQEQATQSQDPMVVLIEMATAALESGDPQMAFQVCEGLLMLVNQASAPQSAPVFKKGGKIAKFIK